jgi:CheY-like chemotaxis protein
MLRSILYVQPDEVVREITVKVLEHAGYTVFAARDKRGALEQLAHRAVDFVLAEDMLPDGTADEIARFARNRYPGTAVIVVTGSGEPAIEGAHTVLVRPVEPQHVIASIQQIADGTANLDQEKRA